MRGELNLTNNTQLRGQALLDKIESCLKQLSSEKEAYLYNASELSRAVGCSRPTLNKHTEFIDKILNKINAGKRIKKDHPLVEHLHTSIYHLELEKEALEKELNALRTHHAKIYSVLYMNSVDIAILIKEDIEDESVKYGKCILCDSLVADDHEFPKDGTVIHLSDHKY